MAKSGDKVYPTPAQLRDVGVWVQAEGLVSGLDYDEGYDANELMTAYTLGLRITPESAKEVGHDGDKLEDLSVELQVPTVDSPDCSSHFTFAGLNLVHRVNVSIYGPHPALTHEDWVSSGGCGELDDEGNFTVEAAGLPTLLLTIPNNFESIQAEVWFENLPVGGPSVPTSYWYHKADQWADAYGKPRPKPNTGNWDATWEGVYCWRGWGWLKTRFKVPADTALTLRLAGKTLYPVDNHMSGSDSETGDNRQNTYECSWSSWTATCSPHMIVSDKLERVTKIPHGLDQTIYWRVCLDDDAIVIDPEVVNTVELSGMADGDWQLLEPPTLVLDPVVTVHSAVKVFEAAAKDGDEHHEGRGYKKGGISAVVDYVDYHALVWGDTENKNFVEDTGGIFDRLISANYEIDYTTAWTLQSYADLITYCSDAWAASLNTTAYNAATKDADDNQLGVWAFDIREAQSPAPTSPLEQNVDGGTALVALRCGSWQIARGVLCTLVTDKTIGGRAHGDLLGEENVLYRNALNALRVWRSSDGSTWSSDHTVSSGETGQWCSKSLQEYIEDTDDPWRWGVCVKSESIPSVTWQRAPYREYVRGDLSGLAIKYYDPALALERGGIVWRATTDNSGGGHLRVMWCGAQTDMNWVPVTQPSTEGGFTRPSITVAEGALYVCATDMTSNTMRVWRSYDRGATWTELP